MKLSRWFLGDLAGIMAAALLVALVTLAVSAVVFRYAVGAPLAWAEEVESLLLLWIIMIGLVYGKRKNMLLRMDILLNLFSPGVRRVVMIIQECVHVGMFGLMAYYGYTLALQVGSKGTSMLGIPLYWLYISLPIGAAGALVIAAVQLYCQVTGQEAE